MMQRRVNSVEPACSEGVPMPAQVLCTSAFGECLEDSVKSAELGGPRVGRDNSNHAAWQGLTSVPLADGGTPLLLTGHGDVMERAAIKGIIVFKASHSIAPSIHIFLESSKSLLKRTSGLDIILGPGFQISMLCCGCSICCMNSVYEATTLEESA